jgi:hypothetical protein
VRTLAAAALSALVLLAAGCDDEPTTLDGATAYDAGSIARDAMDDEVLDEDSLAHGRTWVIDDTTADRMEDGAWAWRVTFVAVGDRSTTLCMWVRLTERTLREESYEYVVDRCPADGEETGEPS